MAKWKWYDPEGNFWSKVSKTSDCWLWMGSKRKSGYGHFRYMGRLQSAHRVAWQLAFGPIPAGMNVLHRCDNPSCVRPDHLFLGTQADNMADKMAKKRYKGPGGISPETIEGRMLAVVRMRSLGLTLQAIGARFGVTRQRAHQLIRRGLEMERLLRTEPARKAS